jgi:MYXO-CTERM domain-containing protein
LLVAPMLRCLSPIALGGLFFASGASAQITITPLEPDRTEFETNGFNARDCETNTVVRLDLNNVPDRMFVVFFRGDSCNEVDRRDGSTTVADCDRLFSVERTTDRMEVDQRIQDFLDCDEEGAAIHIFAIASDTSTATEEVTTADWGTIDFKLDTTAPATPTGLTDATGGTSVNVPFEPVSNAFRYRLYLDTALTGATMRTEAGPPPDAGGRGDAGSTDAGSDAGSMDAGPGSDAGGGGGAGMCPTDSWLNGGTPDGSGTAISCTANCEAEVSLAGLAIGQTAAVAITAEDQAGNESPFSQVVCVTRVMTTDYCDLLMMEGKQCEDGCSCSSGRSDPVAIGLLALGLFVVRRRRWRA